MNLRNNTILTLLVSLFMVSQLLAQLDVSPPPSVDVSGPPGQILTIPVNLTNPQSVSIDAFGFTFLYPTDRLTFQNVSSTGTLTAGWTTVDGNETTLGEITVGGFDNGGGTTGEGVLLNVLFEVEDGAGVGLLQLTTFLNDITGATTTDGTLNSTVPVELVSFSAQVIDDGIKLAWLTASETDNFGFDVERGASRDTFTKIGFVPGNGTTATERRYQFLDDKVSSGIVFYRLKQIDLNGSFEYSNVIEVAVTGPKSFTLSQNYPNPFNPETRIEFTVPNTSKVEITIYDELGRTIRKLVNEQYGTGTYSITWNGKNDAGQLVASGLYLYAIKSGQFTSTRKMIFLK